MASPPTTFADLIEKIAGPPAPDQLHHRPLFGRATELDAGLQAPGGDWWVLLHSTSTSGVVLIHAHPVNSKQLQVKLDASLSAILSVVVDVKSTRAVGELFETVAEFVGLNAPPGNPGGATITGN